MDIHCFLITCSIITTVRSFPSPTLFDSAYLDQDIIMCDENIDKVANDLCMRHLPNFKFHLQEFHQKKGLLLTSICCVETCTAGQIFTQYCLDENAVTKQYGVSKNVPNIKTTSKPAVYSHNRPIITHITKNVIGDIGSTVQLVCTILHSKDYNVLWFRINRKINSEPDLLAAAQKLIIKNPRFSLRYEVINNDLHNYILQIKDIQEIDEEFYRCQVSFELDYQVSDDVELNVRRNPMIFDNSTKSLVVYEGQPVDLECYAGGFPTPRVSWKRLKNQILPMGGSVSRGNILKIPFIKSQDRGIYCCVAENGFSIGARHNIVLEVQFGPIITVGNLYVGQAIGYEQDLSCHIEAFPAAAINWLKNEVSILNNKHYDIANVANGDDITDSTLHFNSVQKPQYGEYICRASNIFGTAEATVMLFEVFVPVCPPACT